VIAVVEGSSAVGVKGEADGVSGIGVFGDAEGTSGTAIVGTANFGGTAGWFSGNVYYTGTLSHYSDARLKKDVRDIPYGLGAALKLHPVTFAWKDDPDAKRHLGLIAQEVQAVVPEIVAEAPNPRGPRNLAIADSELVPLLINAIQEQNKLIEAQDARLRKLEERRSPALLSSMVPGVGGGLAIGLIPLALVVTGRRRRSA
jgi:hypothetical protein